MLQFNSLPLSISLCLHYTIIFFLLILWDLPRSVILPIHCSDYLLASTYNAVIPGRML